MAQTYSNNVEKVTFNIPVELKEQVLETNQKFTTK
jgi:hypothetical protein